MTCYLTRILPYFTVPVNVTDIPYEKPEMKKVPDKLHFNLSDTFSIRKLLLNFSGNNFQSLSGNNSQIQSNISILSQLCILFQGIQCLSAHRENDNDVEYSHKTNTDVAQIPYKSIGSQAADE